MKTVAFNIAYIIAVFLHLDVGTDDEALWWTNIHFPLEFHCHFLVLMKLFCIAAGDHMLLGFVVVVVVFRGGNRSHTTAVDHVVIFVCDMTGCSFL